jgi:hypothetical protein
VAVVVPDMDAVALWRTTTTTSSSSTSFPSSHLDMAEFVPIILEQMKEEGKKQGLKGYELVYAGI